MKDARLDQPSDTRIMNLVHAALRRDLERAQAVLGGPDDVPRARLIALGRHLTWLVDFLHTHHRVEDEYLFPVVATKDPTVEDLAALMDEQHRRIGPAMAHLHGLALDVVAGRRRGAVAAADLCRAVVALVNVLHLHLSDEERLLMPRVEELLTEREWQDFDRHNLDRGPLDLAFVGHWLLDGLQDVDDRHIVTRQVPRVVAWIVLNLMGGPYRQHRRASWSGTPAELIRSSPLPRLPRPSPAEHDTASMSVGTATS